MQYDALREAAAAEVAAARRVSRFWVWLRKWSKRAKLASEIAGLVALIFGGAAKAWVLYKARSVVGPAELPKGNSMPTVGTDWVERPKGQP